MARAQDAHPILSEFVAIRQHKGILLRWTIRGGNQCEGTKVYRAHSQLPFEQIKHISGICGGADFDETYTHLDTLQAKNVENHYQLEMGDLGFTNVVSLFYVDYGQSNHARLTDAFNGTITLLFDNAQQDVVSLQLIDRSGSIVLQQQTNSNTLTILTHLLNPGIYTYRIAGAGNSPITGRFALGQ